MKQKIKMMLLMTLVVVALTACSCNGQSATPTPMQSQQAATPMPSAQASQSPSLSPDQGSSASPESSQGPTESQGAGASMDIDGLKTEVEKLSEVDTGDVVSDGSRAIVGLSFDAQYQGTLTERIEEMVNEKITGKEAGITDVAVTADPTLVTEIRTLANETGGSVTLTDEQQSAFDELYTKIKPAAESSPAA